RTAPDGAGEHHALLLDHATGTTPAQAAAHQAASLRQKDLRGVRGRQRTGRAVPLACLLCRGGRQSHQARVTTTPRPALGVPLLPRPGRWPSREAGCGVAARGAARHHLSPGSRYLCARTPALGSTETPQQEAPLACRTVGDRPPADGKPPRAAG